MERLISIRVHLGLSLLILLGINFGCRKQIINSVSPDYSPQNKSPSHGEAPLFGKWPASEFPLDLTISEDFNFLEKEQILSMMGEWKEAANQKWPFFNDDIMESSDPKFITLSDYHDGQLGIYKAYQWFPELNTYALAITQFFGHRKNPGTPMEYIELEHADIFINYKSFNFSITSPPAAGKYDLSSVVLHELGHLLGLPHEMGRYPSIMSPTLRPQNEERHTQEIDKINLRKSYPINNMLRELSMTQESENSLQDGEPISGIIELMSDGTCHVIFSFYPYLSPYLKLYKAPSFAYPFHPPLLLFDP